MEIELTFRIFFTLSLLTMWAARLYFHRKAGTSRERTSVETEGRLIITVRLIGAVIMFAYPLAYVINPDWLAWSFFPRSAALGWLGAVLTVLGVIGLSWVTASLDTNFHTSLVVRDEHTLITSGLYRWIRHPMYTVILVMFVGWLLLIGSWFVGVATVVFVAVIMLMRTRREEAMMIERFGDEYRAYMGQTGRFLPRFKRSS